MAPASAERSRLLCCRELVQEHLDNGLPETRILIDQEMAVFARCGRQDELCPRRAGADKDVVHPARDGRGEEVIVLTINPQRRNVRARPVALERIDKMIKTADLVQS